MLRRALSYAALAAGLICLTACSGCRSRTVQAREQVPEVYQGQYDKLVDEFELVDFKLTGEKIFERCPPGPGNVNYGVDPGTGADALGFTATRESGQELSGYLCNNTVILNAQ